MAECGALLPRERLQSAHPDHAKSAVCTLEAGHVGTHLTRGGLRFPREGSGLQPGLCKSCGARIWWVVMGGTDARMPVDADPQWVVTIESDGKAVTRDGYRSHFATCPNADQHRKRGRKGAK